METDADAQGLGRIESIEKLANAVRIDAGAEIAHGKARAPFGCRSVLTSSSYCAWNRERNTLRSTLDEGDNWSWSAKTPN